MNFTAFAFSTVVDSTINGNKGVDNISIGDVALASGFTVFGGQGNDVITSTNANADGIVYSGDDGDDQITTTGAADVVVNGGEGVDVISTAGGDDTIDGGVGDDVISSTAGGDNSIDGGTGDDIITAGGGGDVLTGGVGDDELTGGAGDDALVGGVGDDSFIANGGDDTVTGGAGADSYDLTGGGENDYIISAITDSSASLSGTAVGFDDFGVGFNSNTDHIDISAVASSLLGATAGRTTTVAVGANILTSATTTFAALRSELSAAAGTAAGLNASAANVIRFNVVTVDDGVAADSGIDGTYLIVNNSNGVMDGGDLMFEVDSTDVTVGGAVTGGDYTNFAALKTNSAWVIS
jgi:hypothetical protein